MAPKKDDKKSKKEGQATLKEIDLNHYVRKVHFTQIHFLFIDLTLIACRLKDYLRSIPKLISQLVVHKEKSR